MLGLRPGDVREGRGAGFGSFHNLELWWVAVGTSRIALNLQWWCEEDEKSKNEPRLSSWLVFVTHRRLPLLPPPHSLPVFAHRVH